MGEEVGKTLIVFNSAKFTFSLGLDYRMKCPFDYVEAIAMLH